MIDIITFLDNDVNSAVYTGEYIHGIYSYLEIIGAPTTFATSGRISHHFSTSYSINNDTASLQTVISYLCMRQKSICELCRRIGHKSDACIIRGQKFLPLSLRRNINQFNALHGEEPNEPPREWSDQPPEDHFKLRTSPTNTSPVVSAIMGILNHYDIDNGDVNTSDFPIEFNYESVPDPDTTPIKSIDDD